MSRLAASVAVAMLLLFSSASLAGPWRICTANELRRLNERLYGYVHDFTANHDQDRRFYSPSLKMKRDLLVYTPPGYDPRLQYPVMIWMHGFRQDEKEFHDIVPYFDRLIARGELPPLIVVAPDGSIRGRPTFFTAGSFYLNSKAGNFADYIAYDVWNFVVTRFSIRPEREAHVLAGASMGGFGAYNLGIKYRDRFAHVIGVFPPLNLRYVDCHGRYFADFDPNCFGMRTKIRRYAPVARFYGVIVVRQLQILNPLFGRFGDPVPAISCENPIEMIYSYDLRPGELNMFVGYGTRDEFNIDAQIESFLYCARKRGLTITVETVPRGRHNFRTGVAILPSVSRWLAPQIAPYAPAMCVPGR